MDVSSHADHVLQVAMRQLTGTITRTTTSVIGRRGNETVIVATTQRGWMVTVLLQQMKIAFVATPKGLFRKSLVVEGTPSDLVSEILDEKHFGLVNDFAPMRVQLMSNGIRLEKKYGGPDEEIATAMDLVAALAGRARFAQQMMTAPKRAIFNPNA
jgi:hypothetical protein